MEDKVTGKSKLVKIGEIAKLVTVLPSTIRYYSDLGLLPYVERSKGGFRLYDLDSTLERLRILQKLEKERFTLKEIKEKLDEELEQSRYLRALIVDDDPDVADLIVSTLTENGRWLCRVAADGFAAGKQAMDFSPHLVILDLVLPGMDGFRVCSELRRDERFNKIKIIAISGYDTAEHRERIKSAGADDFLAKPILPVELRKKIETFFPDANKTDKTDQPIK